MRVLPGFHEEPPDLAALAAGEERFFVLYPVDAAVSESLVRVAGHEPVPDETFPTLRSGTWDEDTGEESWYEVTDTDSRHVGALTPELRKLSTAGIVNHATFVDWIASGWKPEDYPPEGYLDGGGERPASGTTPAAEEDEAVEVAFYSYLPTREAAEDVARALREEQLDVEVSESRNGDGTWLVLARAEESSGLIETLEQAITTVVEAAGGEYDGHEIRLGG
jgi:hypothetical protein